MNNKKKHFNILMIGPAGSGKGTQGDLIKDKRTLFKLSAGDALREERKNNGKYAQEINKYIDSGALVPFEITNNIIAEKLEKEVYSNTKYDGIIFDGYPRQIEQAKFITDFLKKKDEKINLVINIQVPLDKLIERLNGRFMCDKCGEIYHKISKKPQKEGICDKCGNIHFSQRVDDANIDSIKNRFHIFENETSIVLNYYKEITEIFTVDGAQSPNQTSEQIINHLNKVMNK